MMSRVRAPELPQHFPWLNTDQPLSLRQLRGRVILLDFWTYGCINCLHVLPDLAYLERTYGDDLVIIGIHSAKFSHEQTPESVQQAIQKYAIAHPVLLDQANHVWEAYAVKAWPTLILIDAAGYIVGRFAGEGRLAEIEGAVQGLLQRTFSKPVGQLNEVLSESSTPLRFPGKVLVDEVADRLFITDSGHHRLVLTTLSGALLAVIGNGHSGFQDGHYTSAQFSSPQGLALDRAHHCLYVADTGNHAIRCVDLGQEQVTTLVGTGQQSRTIAPHCGIGQQLALNSPWDLALQETTLFIAMAGSHQIWQVNLTNLQSQTFAGRGVEGCLDGSPTAAAFAQPSGLAIDWSVALAQIVGTILYVADSESSSIRAVALGDQATVRTLCGSGDLFDFGDQDGIGSDVRLQHCLGIGTKDSLLWIADTYNHNVKRADPATGRCQTIAGTGIAGYRDGTAQTAQFFEPSGLSASSSGLFIADTNNHQIRYLDMESYIVKTFTIPDLCSPYVCLPSS